MSCRSRLAWCRPWRTTCWQPSTAPHRALGTSRSSAPAAPAQQTQVRTVMYLLDFSRMGLVKYHEHGV